MSSKSDDTFWWLTIFFVGGALVLGVVLYSCNELNDCARKHCEHGAPMIVRARSEAFLLNEECVCVERAQ